MNSPSLHPLSFQGNDFSTYYSYKGLFSSNDVKHLAEESKKMAKFDHPNVMKLIGVSLSMDTIPFLVMPFMANGSLLSYLRKNRPELTVKNDMTELVNVINHIQYHWHNHIHRVILSFPFNMRLCSICELLQLPQCIKHDRSYTLHNYYDV